MRRADRREVAVTPDRATKWAEIRKQGQWSFVWRVGVLSWGFTMCCIFVVMQAAQHPNRVLLIVAYNVPIWLSAGLLFGLLTWWVFERSYKRHLAKSTPSTGD